MPQGGNRGLVGGVVPRGGEVLLTVDDDTAGRERLWTLREAHAEALGAALNPGKLLARAA